MLEIKSLTAKLQQQGYQYHKLRNNFSIFYRRHYELDLFAAWTIGTTILRRFSIINKFKKIVGRTDFSDQFRKIVIRYKRIDYNLNVMRQSACLVFNQIRVNKHASLSNCTPVGRASDSMMVST